MTAGRAMDALGGSPRDGRALGRGWPAALLLAALLWGGAASASDRAAPPTAAAMPAPARVPHGAATPPGTAAAAPASRQGGVVLDFPRGTGAALLRRGAVVLAVFDSPDLRNPEALRHPTLAGLVEATALPGGLVLAMPADRARAVGLLRGPSGWTLGPPRPPANGGEAEAASLGTGGGSAAPAVAIEGVPPNRVVVVRDPETGLPLLVGTTRDAGRGSAGGRRAPEYDLLRTELGVAVLARSESVQLQALPDRFLLSGSVLSPLSLDAAAIGSTAAAAMTRCLGLPDLPPDQLLVRLRSQGAQLAATEPLARAGRRRDLAATMLALGMAQEAQAEMKRAVAEDAGALAAAPGARALAGAAALVAGRVEEAAAVLRPDAAAAPAPDCDELVLLRSLFLARAGDPPAALPGLRATLPLLRAYPPGLRDRLLPAVAEAFAEAGAWPHLRALLAEAPAAAGPPLPLAAAMLLEADGDENGALAAFDALARGRDRRARSVAARRAVELRLRTGRMDHAAAARAYAALAVAWRGDAAEREARTRQAQLLALADDAGAALALLRQTAALFPDGAPALRREAGRVLRGALESGSPLAAVAAFGAASDLLPPEERDVAEARLVDLLLALDLPARASALLREAAGRATGRARAEIGSRLAALRLREGDAAGARTALDETDAPEMAEELRARRTALAAEAAAAGERRAEGGAAPPAPDTPRADAGAASAADAALGRRDWAAAAQALHRRLDARLPAAPAPLDQDGREAVLRLAAALSLAGDDSALAALRDRVGDRMGEGPYAEAFARLVAAPPRPAATAAARTAAVPAAAPAAAAAPR